jgi:predicted MFS family arabinose efflux permease
VALQSRHSSSTRAVVAGRLSQTFAAREVPHYTALWFSGWFWNLTRWMALFLGSFLVNDLSDSVFLVQLVGVAFFAPMFLGGILAGVLADRFDRRRTILWQLVYLIPIAVLMGVLAIAGLVETWMAYPFVFAVGFGGVIDITSRRALIYDLVGEARSTNALALETVSISTGNILGASLGGAMINFIGIGEAFLLIGAFYLAAFALLLTVPSPPHDSRRRSTRSAFHEVRLGIAYTRRNQTLISMLGITVIINMFFFPFLPLFPVFADRLEVNALLAGILASSMGIGMFLGAIGLAAWTGLHRGRAYAGGSAIALIFLTIFALMNSYPAALVTMIIAGVGMAGFSTMQSLLSMAASAPRMRGRAMGMLSMAIGALPFGMLALGGLAQAIGTEEAVTAGAVAGLIALALWLVIRPEVRRFP